MELNNDRNLKELSNLTKWIRYFIYIQVIISFLSIGSGLLEYSLLSDFQSGNYISQEQAVIDAEASDLRQQIIAIVTIIVFLITLVLIYIWVYRANYNAGVLSSKRMIFSPKWSVLWFFIPIASFWKPYQVLKEIWLVSQKENEYKLMEESKILPLWWTFWVISALLGQVIFRLSLNAEGIPQLLKMNRLYMAADVIDILAAIFTFLLITNIYNFQAGFSKVPVIEQND